MLKAPVCKSLPSCLNSTWIQSALTTVLFVRYCDVEVWSPDVCCEAADQSSSGLRARAFRCLVPQHLRLVGADVPLKWYVCVGKHHGSDSDVITMSRCQRVIMSTDVLTLARISHLARGRRACSQLTQQVMSAFSILFVWAFHFTLKHRC